MKIRLMGTEAECTAAVDELARSPGLEVLEVSQPRANRGESRLVRVYVEARLSGSADRGRPLAGGGGAG